MWTLFLFIYSYYCDYCMFYYFQVQHVSFMRKVLLIALFIVLVLVPVYTNEQENEEKPEIDYEAQMRQQASMKRTACLVLSRYHTNSHKQDIEQIMNSLSGKDQQLYINKLYAVAVQKCMPSITLEQAQQFFIEQQQFDPTSMFYILDGMDYASVANDLENLTPNQKNIIRFIKEFDEEMQVKKEEREFQKDVVDDGDDIGIFGVPVSSFNSIAGYAYILVFVAVVAGAFIWGFSQLNNSALPRNKTKKAKSPKKQ